jgi:hypothetical protein
MSQTAMNTKEQNNVMKNELPPEKLSTTLEQQSNFHSVIGTLTKLYFINNSNKYTQYPKVHQK